MTNTDTLVKYSNGQNESYIIPKSQEQNFKQTLLKNWGSDFQREEGDSFHVTGNQVISEQLSSQTNR